MISKCACGCDQIISGKVYRNGKGRFTQRFVTGHNARGTLNPNYKSARYVTHEGYVKLLMRDHPRAGHNGYVLEHILVVESALGHPLPSLAVIHHVNEQPADNGNCNLVVCQDSAYHALLHRRTRAYDATGHADWVRCRFCKEWGSLLTMRPSGKSSFNHLPCASRYAHEHLKPIIRYAPCPSCLIDGVAVRSPGRLVVHSSGLRYRRKRLGDLFRFISKRLEAELLAERMKPRLIKQDEH